MKLLAILLVATLLLIVACTTDEPEEDIDPTVNPNPGVEERQVNPSEGAANRQTIDNVNESVIADDRAMDDGVDDDNRGIY